MKYSAWPGFLNHLEEANTHGHLSCIYGVCGGTEGDRRFAAQKILEFSSNLKISRFKGEENHFSEALNTLNSLSLFAETPCVIFEAAEKLSKEDIALCSHFLENPSPSSRLILAFSTFKGAATTLYQSGKKEMVVLDLSQEKPWDRPQRLKSWVEHLIKKAQKKITTDALTYLLENSDPEMESFQQTLDKIFCFIGQRDLVQKEDIQKLLAQKLQGLNWQLAETLLFGSQKSPIDMPKDPGELIVMIGALKFQMHNAQKLLALLRKRATSEEIATALPQLRAAQLEKQIQRIKKYRLGFLTDVAKELFEIEFALKQSRASPQNLFQTFILKLELLKKHHVS